MNDWFTWKGTRCTDYGIHVVQQPEIIRPPERATFTSVPGRSGTLTTLEGLDVYDDFLLTVECMISDTTQLDTIIREVTGRPVVGAGATSQWNDSANWSEKGVIAQMPDKPCAMFVQKGSTMSHTGLYVGNGQAIHASGHGTGVIESPMPRSWTHYAIPIGLYEGGEIPVADEYLLRRRDKGPRVKALQEGLLKLGYKMPRYGADSDFGAETEAVVRQFQLDHGQPVDSVWDLDCQAKLTAALAAIPELPDESSTVDLDAIIAALMAHRASLDRALEVLMDARDR